MKKSDLVSAFSQVCNYIADNAQDLLVPNLDDTQEMITPIFEDVPIDDIDKWWEDDNNLSRYLLQIEELAAQDPASRQENIEHGLAEIQESETLMAQLRQMTGINGEGNLDVLKHIPHVADYARQFKQTEGFKKLDALCLRMDNVIVWPTMTVNTEAGNLKKAFYLNVSVLSTDGSPLKPKLQNLPRLAS